MRGIRYFFNSLLIVGLFCIPFIAVGVVFLGTNEAIGGAFFGVFLVFLLSSLSEWGMAVVYKANIQIPKGLKRSLELTVTPDEVTPRVMVFNSLSPHALVARSLGGGGVILLSQGLLVLLTENELRAILRLCLTQIKDRGIVFQSFCSLLATVAIYCCPRSWANLIFSDRVLAREEEKSLSPFSAIRFVLALPFIRLFFKTSIQPLSHLKESSFDQTDQDCRAALQKISQSIYSFSADRNQVVFPFCFFLF